MSLRQMPGYEVLIASEDLDPDDPCIYVSSHWKPITRRSCSKGCRGRCKCVTGSDNADYTAEVCTADERIAAIVCVVEDALHEAMEWYTFDGAMAADPHGNGEYIVRRVSDVLTTLLNEAVASDPLASQE